MFNWRKFEHNKVKKSDIENITGFSWREDANTEETVEPMDVQVWRISILREFKAG